MKTRILAALVLLFAASTALYSQTDTSKTKDSTLTIKYLISSDWTFTLGNLNSFISLNQGQIAIEQKIIGAKILSRYRYGELSGTTIYNEFYTNVDILFVPKNRVYGIVGGGAEFSFLRGLNVRAWGGAGAGFKVLNFEDHLFEPTVGFNYEYSNYANSVLYRGDSISLIQTAISNIGWTGSHKFFNKHLLVVHNFKWSQDLLYATNYRFDCGFTLAVPLIKNFMVKTSIIGSYQNVVPALRKQGDLIWTIGLAWGNL